MLPVPPGFARQEIGRAGLDLDARAAETSSRTLAEAQRCRRIHRNADDLLEHIAIPMPANAGTGIVAGQKNVNEVIRLELCKLRRTLAQRIEPVRNRIGGTEARVFEVVTPAKALCLA